MDVASRQDFLACLGRYPVRNELEVFTHAKRHLLVAADEVGFDDFRGPDYAVIGRLAAALRNRGSVAALWGLVFIDLWYCSNFGGPHWNELVRRDPDNVRFALQAAHWVLAVSGADGSPALAAILNRCRCWEVAGQHAQQVGGELHDWWRVCVWPRREQSQAEPLAEPDPAA